MTDQLAPAPVPGFVDLRDRLRAGETLYGSFVGLGSAVATELIARAGFDWLRWRPPTTASNSPKPIWVCVSSSRRILIDTSSKAVISWST